MYKCMQFWQLSPLKKFIKYKLSYFWIEIYFETIFTFLKILQDAGTFSFI